MTWSDVSKATPCQICDKADWCGRTDDGAVRCMRIAEPTPGWRKIKTCDDGGTVFRPDDEEPHREAVSNNPPTKPKPRAAYPTAKSAADAMLRTIQREHGAEWSLVATFPYTDGIGREVAWVLRFEPPDRGPDKLKTVRPIHAADGSWLIGDPPGLWPLYHLPDLNGAGRVYVVEGEGKVEALRSLGLIATTSAHGSRSAAKSDWRPLAGKDVVILRDNDADGLRFADAVAGILTRLGAVVRIVLLPGLPDKGDVVDFIESRDSRESEAIRAEIERLADETEEWKPPVQIPASPQGAVRAVIAPTREEALAARNGTAKRGDGQMAARRGAPRLPAPTMGDDATPTPTDAGNAIRFARQHRDSVRFVPGIGWYVWYGKHWARDLGDLGAMARAKETARSIYVEAANEPNDSERGLIANHARLSEQGGHLQWTVKLAPSEPGMALSAAQLDSDGFLLNVNNGTLNLRTGELRPHDPNDLISKIAPVDYDPAAQCPRWRLFLREIFNNNDALIGYIQRVLGMCLTADISEQYLFIFHGFGANGKSTLLDTWIWLMGEYAGLAPPELLVLTRHAQHPTEIADLFGKRLVVASETESTGSLRLQLVKRLTGDQTLKGRFMKRDFFEFRRTHKLILQTNNKPTVAENSEAVWRRVKLVPFDIVIPEDRRDKHLIDTLKEEGPGILAWGVEGCLAWQQDGLGEPDAVTNATAAYRCEQDAVGEFIADCCIVHKDASVGATHLFQRFQVWCVQNAREDCGQTAFGTQLTALGFVADRSGPNRSKVRRGIGLKAEEWQTPDTVRNGLPH